MIILQIPYKFFTMFIHTCFQNGIGISFDHSIFIIAQLMPNTTGKWIWLLPGESQLGFSRGLLLRVLMSAIPFDLWQEIDSRLSAGDTDTLCANMYSLGYPRLSQCEFTASIKLQWFHGLY